MHRILLLCSLLVMTAAMAAAAVVVAAAAVIAAGVTLAVVIVMVAAHVGVVQQRAVDECLHRCVGRKGIDFSDDSQFDDKIEELLQALAISL